MIQQVIQNCGKQIAEINRKVVNDDDGSSIQLNGINKFNSIGQCRVPDLLKMNHDENRKQQQSLKLNEESSRVLMSLKNPAKKKRCVTKLSAAAAP